MSLHFISPDLPASFIVTFIAVVKSRKILLIRGLHESGVLGGEVTIATQLQLHRLCIVDSEAESVSAGCSRGKCWLSAVSAPRLGQLCPGLS